MNKVACAVIFSFLFGAFAGFAHEEAGKPSEPAAQAAAQAAADQGGIKKEEPVANKGKKEEKKKAPAPKRK